MVYAPITWALEPVYSDFFGHAIKGYDPVAYFTQSKPVKGDSDYQYQWNGANWRFSSEQNLQAFKAEPEKYAPQYGGYCAWAVSQGYTAKIDPDAWSIENGKLYLNYNRSVQKKWLQDPQGNIAKADQHWPRLLVE
ncbi:YHS domain-containing (seleno)protein [Vibrio hippocampi]